METGEVVGKRFCQNQKLPFLKIDDLGIAVNFLGDELQVFSQIV